MSLGKLVMVFAPGCDACELHEPWFASFQARNPGVACHRKDYTDGKWRVRQWEPKVTPSFVLQTARSRQLHIHSGPFQSEQELHQWVLSKL